MKFLHGTTRRRAEAILRNGPDPDFRESPGDSPAGAFCLCRSDGPFEVFGHPAAYAVGKAKIFPEEGGPAIIEVEIPEEIVALRVDPGFFPLSQGVVEFDVGYGLEQLHEAWPSLPKRLIPLGD